MARRSFGAGLGALALGLVVVSATRAAADEAAGLDGEWGGAQNGVTAQVIVSNGAVIGFFWRGDYIDASASKLSADGRSLAFAFSGGEATLTRTGETTAMIEIRDGGRRISMALQRG